MPALQAFGRRWHVGSDDFVLPGICDLIIRISWFIATAVVYWKSNEDLDGVGCDGGTLIKQFLYGIFGILQLIIFADIALVHNSKAGSIMETEKRKWVPLCLYFRTLLAVAELVWNIIGTYWLSQEILTCAQAPGAENLVQGLIICNWLLVAFTLVLFPVMFDSLGRREFDLSPDVFADHKLATCWNRRWRFLCLVWWTKNKDVQATFRDMGYYMAAAFESSDLTLSDVICGLILLFLKHRETKKRQNELQSVSVEKILEAEEESDQISIQSNNNRDGIEWPKTEEWNNLGLIHHFYQYAVASYTWGAILCTSSNPLWSLWKDAFCCGCIRKKRWDADIEGDNCCFLNTGSANDAIKLENTEILYCSFHDKVFQTPFFVALDHTEKAIVVAIRGTMSRVDVVTDINVRPESLARFGYPESYRVHKGMLMNALKVLEKIEELQIIPNLLRSHPDYKIVTTGTSLGSASATLLSMIYKQQFPNVDVKCFAYSPSGALMNLETAKFCESFVTSVIYGDDFVARLAVKSIERLKYDVVSILRECRTPKYQILLGGLYCLCGGRPKVTFSPDMDSLRRESRQELISAYGFDFAEINVVPMKGEKRPFYLSAETELTTHKPKCKKASRAQTPGAAPPLPHKLLPFELMYPPGKILHVTETSAFRSGRRAKNDSKPRWNIRWADRQEFREIIITSRMMMDHVPFRPNKALLDLTRRWRQSSDDRNDAQLRDPVIISDIIISSSKSNSSISSPVPIDDLVLSSVPSNKPS
ncbi:unnamed protein product [Orchesella dallaii]|uniref:sn-1-specific diacylglycerol lipase n=1 Tax=Orchesella dallaii TaxID=48710 RepID=A0ABP1QZ34_9HEXA